MSVELARSLHDEMVAMADQARAASRELVQLSTRKKNNILEAMADALEASVDRILAANELDMEAGRKDGLTDALLDRLLLTQDRVSAMAQGLRDIAALKDPVGEEISSWMRPNGLEIVKTRVPIGVIGMIYESRPNVTADAAGLCLKTSNAVILRGGKEAIHSNRAIAEILNEGGVEKGLPLHAIQLIGFTDREAIRELVQMDGKVDLIIPRGGEGLIRAVAESASVPVLKHYKGLCHIFVDETADVENAVAIVENAKCQRPGVCNAVETVLVHAGIADAFLPALGQALGGRVELRGDDAVCGVLSSALPATEDDWHAEYLDLILAVRVVDSVDAAVDHINTYGSGHSDSILSASESSQKQFARDVDSATVYINASTRFTDGSQFGMGAEIGISTDKLHARGPVGLEELTTYKYVINGRGQIRE